MENNNKESYFKQYYNKNKDLLNSKQKEKVKCCICGMTVCKNYITKHKK